MRSVSLMAPYRFRFTEPADAQQFGDGWFVYDEARIVKLPARQLARMEAELGQPIVTVMDGFRNDTVMGRLACTWLAIYLQDPDLAGRFADYSPVVLLLNLEPVPDDEVPVESTEAALGPLDPTPTATSGSGSAAGS